MAVVQLTRELHHPPPSLSPPVSFLLRRIRITLAPRSWATTRLSLAPSRSCALSGRPEPFYETLQDYMLSLCNSLRTFTRPTTTRRASAPLPLAGHSSEGDKLETELNRSECQEKEGRGLRPYLHLDLEAEGFGVAPEGGRGEVRTEGASVFCWRSREGGLAARNRS